MGLAGAIQITDSGPENKMGGGGGLINPQACRDLANRLQLDFEASGASSIEDPPLFEAVVWPGPARSSARADGTLGADRLGMKCRRAAMWLTEACG